MGYYEDLKIDRYNLEKELVRQPQLFMEWALKAAIASVDREDAKNRVELIRAEIDKKIRSNPEEYGISESKSTDRAIKLAVENHRRVKKFYKKYLKKLRDEKILNEAKTAFNHRKKMLESLVSLNIQLHFSEPKVPVEKKEMMYQDSRRSMLKQMRKKPIKRRNK